MSFTFIVNLYKEPLELVERLNGRLSEVYPNSKILYLSDGPDAIRYGKNNLTFDHRLKVPSSPGKWIHRYLETFIQNSDSEYCIKIDPDASVIGEMTKPIGDVFCAKLYYPSLLKSYLPHAGIIGFSRSYAKQLVDEKLLLREVYTIVPVYLNREERVFMHLFKETNANIVDRPDFCCGPIRNREYANQPISFRHK